MPKKKKSLINSNKDLTMNENQDNKVSTVIPISFHPVGSCVPFQDYNALCVKYKECEDENKSLKKQLSNILDTDIKELKNGNELLKNENKSLNERIKQLEQENQVLRDIINKQNIKIKTLEDTLNEHLRKEYEKESMFISAELCTSYEESINIDIFGVKDKCKLHEIINNEIKLTEEQQIKWYKHYDDMKLYNLTNINKYMFDLRDDRNYYAHITYKPFNFSQEEYKKHVYSFIESFQDKPEIENKYKNAVNYMISKIEDQFKKKRLLSVR